VYGDSNDNPEGLRERIAHLESFSNMVVESRLMEWWIASGRFLTGYK
jgi:hypothetical protein